MTAYRRHELARVVTRARGRIIAAADLDAREQALAAVAVTALADLADALDHERQAEPIAAPLDLDLRTRLIERRRA